VQDTGNHLYILEILRLQCVCFQSRKTIVRAKVVKIIVMVSKRVTAVAKACRLKSADENLAKLKRVVLEIRDRHLFPTGHEIATF